MVPALPRAGTEKERRVDYRVTLLVPAEDGRESEASSRNLSAGIKKFFLLKLKKATLVVATPSTSTIDLDF